MRAQGIAFGVPRLTAEFADYDWEAGLPPTRNGLATELSMQDPLRMKSLLSDEEVAIQ